MYSDLQQNFSVIERADPSQIRDFAIHQEGYNCYKRYSHVHLVIIPEVIKRLIAVESITISACVEELPVALSELKNLKFLDLSGCYNLLSIPEIVQEMENLKIRIWDITSEASAVAFIPMPWNGITLSVFSFISSCKGRKIEQLIIRQSPSQYQQTDSPPTDTPTDPDPFQLPDEIRELKKLRLLSIQGNLTSVPLCIGDLRELTILNVSRSSNLISLPESIGNLSQLTSLDLSGCCSLASLPSSIGNLSKLTSLKLNDCSSLVSLPESIWNLPLSSLNLSWCVNLATLPESIGNLSKLTSLNMSECLSLKSLPDSLCSLSELTSLNLRGCDVNSFPDIFSLKQLHHMVWPNGKKWDGSTIEEISSLDLSRCSNLVSLPSSIGNLDKVTSLNLSGCRNLESLPKSIGNLSNLTSLDLSECSNLKCFPSSMQNLPLLTNVKLTHCDFKSIPSGIEYLKEVTELDLSSCHNLVSLPESIGILHQLHSI